MSEFDPGDGSDGPEETLPPGVEEPTSEQPEADVLEQQLLPESGEGPESEEPPTAPQAANEADVAEQEQDAELDADNYRE